MIALLDRAADVLYLVVRRMAVMLPILAAAYYLTCVGRWW